MNTTNLIAMVNKMPKIKSYEVITQEEFDAVLMNPELCVVEKTFYSKFETNQVLFVIKDNEIDYVLVKEVTDKGTLIYKEA